MNELIRGSRTFECENLAATQAAGRQLAGLLRPPAIVYLQGAMGAGKTTLCQAIIHALGFSGAVTSPTYNLVHEYPVASAVIYHLDLYRLNDPTEIEFLAIEDMLRPDSLLLIEWPERGAGFLPAATHLITIQQHELQGKGDSSVREITLSVTQD